MPYVQRNDRGEVLAVSQVPGEGLEPIPADAPELAAFLNSVGGEAQLLSATDQDFIRVLEDVVELLVAKGVILFTELPDSAQDKMLHRQKLRSSLSGKLDLIGDD